MITCSYARCSNKAEVNYLGKELCDKHWIAFCKKQEEEWDKNNFVAHDKKNVENCHTLVVKK